MAITAVSTTTLAQLSAGPGGTPNLFIMQVVINSDNVAIAGSEALSQITNTADGTTITTGLPVGSEVLSLLGWGFPGTTGVLRVDATHGLVPTLNTARTALQLQNCIDGTKGVAGNVSAVTTLDLSLTFLVQIP